MGVASVRRPGSTPDPINSVRRPDSISICPRTAIMAPLSTHNPLGGATQVAPRGAVMSSPIWRNRRLQATPPPRRTSVNPVCAKARSATSMHAAKACSCKDQQTRSKGWPDATAAEACTREQPRECKIHSPNSIWEPDALHVIVGVILDPCPCMLFDRRSSRERDAEPASELIEHVPDSDVQCLTKNTIST